MVINNEFSHKLSSNFYQEKCGGSFSCSVYQLKPWPQLSKAVQQRVSSPE